LFQKSYSEYAAAVFRFLLQFILLEY